MSEYQSYQLTSSVGNTNMDDDDAIQEKVAFIYNAKLSDDGPQSHDYEAEESPVWQTEQSQIYFRDRNIYWTSSKRRSAKRWILTFIIGFLTALLALFITYCTKVTHSF